MDDEANVSSSVVGIGGSSLGIIRAYTLASPERIPNGSALRLAHGQSLVDPGMLAPF
jgi:hypothetical protein